jgi:hypothetical protein
MINKGVPGPGLPLVERMDSVRRDVYHAALTAPGLLLGAAPIVKIL